MYLIKIRSSMYYRLNMEVIDAHTGQILNKTAVYCGTSLLKPFSDDYTEDLSELYKEKYKYHELKKDFFAGIYAVYSKPRSSYRKYLSSGYGAGIELGFENILFKRVILSAYAEGVKYSTKNSDINSSKTLKTGLAFSCYFPFSYFRLKPELSLGNLYSKYSVKYDDMSTDYNNFFLRGALEFDIDLMNHFWNTMVFISPAVSCIFEPGNTFFEKNINFGLKKKF